MSNRFSNRIVVLAVLILLLAACNGTAPATQAVTQQIVNTKTPVVLTATTEPTATLPPPTPTPSGMPTGSDITWRLVVVSEASGWGLGAAFANQITTDVGVNVVVDDFALEGLTTSEVLEVLKNGTSSIPGLSGLPEALKNADVILLAPSPVYGNNLDTLVSLQSCMAASPSVPKGCSPDAFNSYTTDLEAIWAKIFEIRAGKPTILRGLDAATPLVRFWLANGTFEACTSCWQTYSTAARKASEAFNIPFFSRYDVFNGKEHRIDPFIIGYVRGDGVHPNDSAQIYTSQLLAELGYSPVYQP
jgi:hypothetical protein